MTDEEMLRREMARCAALAEVGRLRDLLLEARADHMHVNVDLVSRIDAALQDQGGGDSGRAIGAPGGSPGGSGAQGSTPPDSAAPPPASPCETCNGTGKISWSDDGGPFTIHACPTCTGEG